jgi:hypothetical protein
MFGIIVAIAVAAFLVDQQYYYGQYWGAVSSMLRQIGHSFGWHWGAPVGLQFASCGTWQSDAVRSVLRD